MFVKQISIYLESHIRYQISFMNEVAVVVEIRSPSFLGTLCRLSYKIQAHATLRRQKDAKQSDGLVATRCGWIS